MGGDLVAEKARNSLGFPAQIGQFGEGQCSGGLIAHAGGGLAHQPFQAKDKYLRSLSYEKSVAGATRDLYVNFCCLFSTAASQLTECKTTYDYKTHVAGATRVLYLVIERTGNRNGEALDSQTSKSRFSGSLTIMVRVYLRPLGGSNCPAAGWKRVVPWGHLGNGAGF